jgi:hypothetical protein
MSFVSPPPKPLARTQARTAIARCTREELRLLVQATPHECALMLEAKFFADATIRDPTHKES